LILASRWPINPIIHKDLEIPWQERLLSASITSPSIEFEIHIAHIPPGASHGWLKIDTFNGIFKYLSRSSRSLPGILCGDFNSPQAELETGEVVTWGQSIGKDGSPSLSDRYKAWDAGERSILQGLAKHDFPDVYRLIHGYKKQDFSWIVRRKGKVVAQRRFDHIFGSRQLNPRECKYIHSFREKGLSDHPGIEAEFAPLDSSP